MKFEHESLSHTFCHICTCIMMKESSFKFSKPILPFILSSYQNKNFKNNLTSFNIIEAISFLTHYTKKNLLYNTIPSWFSMCGSHDKKASWSKHQKMIEWSYRKSNVQLNYTKDPISFAIHAHKLLKKIQSFFIHKLR